ncbi:hypothetical protein K933_13257 [Candidatus Halobonum tyrrellensis G22]|uniref:DUF7827 domain-containing protein n=1 Tax=Candidatus Halobonum tyrrellensis G22 TaxID=1324957 RepID=V4HA76_9EURY|nr:hypothetical protein K933_13257 [Candidatus Halobonum tyrrellensis G22]
MVAVGGSRLGRLCALAVAALLLASSVAPVAAAARSPAADATTLASDGEAISLAAGPGQVVRGESPLPPGTTLRVTIEGGGSGTPQFVRATETVVGTDGEFAAVFDLSTVDAGTSVEVSVASDGESLATARGEITECRDACAAPTPESPTASLDAPDGTVTREAGPGRVLAGETNLPPGTPLTVLVGSRDGGENGTTTRTTTTAAGTFRAVVDLSDAPTDAPLRVTVRSDGTDLATSDLTVDPCSESCDRPSGTEPGTDSADEEPVERRANVDDLTLYDAPQGEVVRIPVTFGPSNGTLTVGGENFTYALHLALHDGDDDNRVVVAFDTAKVGAGSEAVRAVDESDSVRVLSERGQSDRSVLDEGSYLLTQRPGGLGPVEHGTLVVRATDADRDTADAPVERFGFPVVREDGEYDGFDPVTTAIGQPARIPFRTDEVERPVVFVGDPNEGFFLRAVVEDGNGDERVTLVLDTAAAANGSHESILTTAASEDSVDVRAVHGRLEAKRYFLRGYVATANQSSPDQSPVVENLVVRSSGRLVVGERGTTPTGSANGGDAVTTEPSARVGPFGPLSGSNGPGPLLLVAVGGLLAVGGVVVLTGAVEWE